MTLVVRGKEPSSVFGLLGLDENSATFALGWALEKSPVLLSQLVSSIFAESLEVQDAVVSLQLHSRQAGGFTDIEIQAGTEYHAVIEAKRYWDAPSLAQFERYSARLAASRARRQRLVSVSAADVATALRGLPADVGGVPLVHLSWGQLHALARAARASEKSLEAKLWLEQLSIHLKDYVAMDRLSNNQVYVVSLSSDPMVEGSSYTWIDAIEKDRQYFHPVGKGWPVQPPNYIAFRYGGKVRSVHHVESFRIVQNLADANTSWLQTTNDHFVYVLGPPMRPASDVSTKGVWSSGRVYCAIDTLLSGKYASVGEALAETKRRLSQDL